ncbi:low temperature requirement protein A [Nonomuraea sp. NPDC050328]|uniref:low temperature requirement protein A n=1 Tax=Nonomuraea sp. NPDC050328 TaxID=3364361 RepID=UPI0037885D80
MAERPAAPVLLVGYGHFGVFAALAALGAGLEVAVEQSGHHVAASPQAIGYAVAIPAAGYLASLWAVHALAAGAPVVRAPALLLCLAALLLLPLTAAWAGVAAVVVLVALACVALLAATLWSVSRAVVTERAAVRS